MSEEREYTRKDMIEARERNNFCLWQTVKKIYSMDATLRRKLFGYSTFSEILEHVDANDAEQITEDYWSKIKDIKPGDEIIYDGQRAICTKVDDDRDGTMYYIFPDGSTGRSAGGYRGPWCKTGIRNTKYVEYLTRLTMGYDMLVDNATGEVIDYAAKNQNRADIPGNQLATGGDN